MSSLDICLHIRSQLTCLVLGRLAVSNMGRAVANSGWESGWSSVGDCLLPDDADNNDDLCGGTANVAAGSGVRDWEVSIGRTATPDEEACGAWETWRKGDI